jgi:hypothetical protein
MKSFDRRWMQLAIFSPPVPRRAPRARYSTAVVGSFRGGGFQTIGCRHPLAPATPDRIVFKLVTNDHTEQSLVWLAQIRSIYASLTVQIPQQILACHLFDPNYKTGILFRNGLPVAGCTFRPCPSFNFAVLRFCGVRFDARRNGYARLLLNHVKTYLQSLSIQHVAAAVDHSVTDFFSQEGFTSDFPPEARFRRLSQVAALYDGQLLMYCYIHHDIDYLNSSYWLKAVSQYLHEQIGKPPSDRVTAATPTAIRGIPIPKQKPPVPPKDMMHAILDIIYRIPESKLFRVPILAVDYPDYAAVVLQPMDVGQIRTQLNQGAYKKIDDFLEDLRLVFSNCEMFFETGSVIAAEGKEFEAALRRECLNLGVKL